MRKSVVSWLLFASLPAPLLGQELVSDTFGDWAAAYQRDLMTDEKSEQQLLTLDTTGGGAKLHLSCPDGSATDISLKYEGGWGGDADAASVVVRFDKQDPEPSAQWKFVNIESPETLKTIADLRKANPSGAAAMEMVVRLGKAKLGGAALAFPEGRAARVELLRNSLARGTLAVQITPADALQGRQHLFSLKGMKAALDWLDCRIPSN